MGKDTKKLVIIGAGGHSNAIISSLNEEQFNSVIGYVDIKENKNLSKEIKYLGNDRDFSNNHSPNNLELIIGLSYVGNKIDLSLRIKIINFYKLKRYKFISIISPYSYISHEAKIGKGVYIAPGSKIIANAKISNFCLINTGAIIEHDVSLGENVQVSSGSVLCGDIIIGDNTFIGAGSVLRDGINIVGNTIIGMGSVVTKNITESGIYAGNPAKLMKSF